MLRVQRVHLVPGAGRISYQEKAGIRTLAKQAVGESLLHAQNQSRGQKTERSQEGGRKRSLEVMHAQDCSEG